MVCTGLESKKSRFLSSLALQLHSALHGTESSTTWHFALSALACTWLCPQSQLALALFGTLPSPALCLPWHLALSALASTWLCLQSQLALPLLALCLQWHLTLSALTCTWLCSQSQLALRPDWLSAFTGTLPSIFFEPASSAIASSIPPVS